MPATRLATAHDLLARRFPTALPEAQPAWDAISTGLPALDRILPSRGFQRGRLAVWTPGVGVAALLQATCLRTVAQGERAVWIDAERLVSGACWRSGPLLVWPHGPIEALRACVTLARSGGFALVVLDAGGIDGDRPAPAALDAPTLVRLTRAAHEGGTALVVLTGAASVASVRLSSRPRLAAYGLRRSRAEASEVPREDDVWAVTIQVEARASGWRAETELSIRVWHDDLRLSLAAGRVDRRGDR